MMKSNSKWWLVALALILLAVSVYGMAQAGYINRELEAYGLSWMTVDDLISTSETLGSYTGRTFYDDIDGLNGPMIFAIKNRTTMLVIGVVLLGIWLAIRARQAAKENRSIFEPCIIQDREM